MAEKNKFHSAYENMLRRIHKFYEHPEKTTESMLQKALSQAKDTAVKLEELTEEEAEIIAISVKRDLQDASMFMNKSGKVLRDWMNFDLMLIEDKLRILFNNAVDTTRVELMNMQQTGEQFAYRTGEVTGPGSLVCQHCAEVLQFNKVSHIPPCPLCSETLFVRPK